jgi:hypothetical protein
VRQLIELAAGARQRDGVARAIAGVIADSDATVDRSAASACAPARRCRHGQQHGAERRPTPDLAARLRLPPPRLSIEASARNVTSPSCDSG